MSDLINVLSIVNKLMKTTTIPVLTELSELIKILDKKSISKLPNLVFPTLLKILDDYNEHNKDEFQTILVNIFAIILSSCEISDVNQARVILFILIRQAYEWNIGKIKPNVSEELKLDLLTCLTKLIQNAPSEITLDLYSNENKKLLSAMCFVCVHYIEHETYRKIRLLAIECLMSIFQVHGTFDPNDIVLRDQVAGMLFFNLPKTMSALLSVIHGDMKQGNQLFSSAIKALGRILCLIMEDYEESSSESTLNAKDFKNLIICSSEMKSDQQVLGMSLKDKSIQGSIQYFEKLKRTPEWLTAASRKIQPFMQGLNTFIANEYTSIRLELAIAACTLIDKCSRFMSSCMPQLFQIAISLSQDENQEISQLCTSTLKNTNFHLDIIETILLPHLIKLPRILLTGSTDEQLTALRLFKGILKILSDTKLKIILSNQETLDKIFTILLSVVVLEQSFDLLNEEYSIRSVDQCDSVGQRPWRQFKYLSTEQLELEISDICCIIAQSTASSIFTNYLLDLLNTPNQNCNEIIVLIQWTIPHCSDSDIINACLDELMSSIHWDLAIISNHSASIIKDESGDSYWHEERTEGLYESAVSYRYTDIRWTGDTNDTHIPSENIITINDAKFHVLHMCLIVETIGKLATCLGSTFQLFLLKSLHRILEKAGSSNYMLHLAGLQTLNDIRIAFEFKEISDLIHANTDYIAFFVNTSLKKPEQCKSALEVLNVVLNYSSMTSISYIENIITMVLDESSKPHQTSENIASFLRVFKIILNGISTWIDQNDIVEECSGLAHQNTNENEEDVCGKWLEILKCHSDVDGENDQDTILTENEETQEDESTEIAEDLDKKIDLPKHIEITKNILQRSLKYIASKNRVNKLLAIEILENGLLIMKTYENEVLPIVHQIWYPFTERLMEKDSVILRRCFALFVVLAKVAKDFITARTSKDILPHLIKFFASVSDRSLNKEWDLFDENTQQFKLVQEMFMGLPKILIDLEVTEKDLNDFLEVIVPFLSVKQPVKLQKGAVKCFLAISEYDATAVYVKLITYSRLNQFQVNVEYIWNKL